MSLAFVCPQRDVSKVVDRIRSQQPSISVQVWPEIQEPEAVQMAVLWKHPKGLIPNFRNLKLVSSFGAGVDHLMQDSEISPELDVTRIVDPSLSGQMADYVVSNILAEHCDLFYYFERQTLKDWSPKARRRLCDLKIGVLGCGEIGSVVAEACRDLGCKTRTWSRSRKNIESIDSFTEPELHDFLEGLNFIVNLLPLTPRTRFLINRSFLKYPARGAVLINVARGEHVVERDVLEALDRTKLSRVILDVFEAEPLSSRSKLWTHPGVRLTPHIASVTDPNALADQCLENYRRLTSSQPPLRVVNRELGY